MSTTMSRRQMLTLLGSTAGSLILAPRLHANSQSISTSSARDTAPTKSTHLRQFSGIYPHLAYFNKHGECGTGAVVPWADRLWVITYAPHEPNGSTDKLYEIDSVLNMVTRPESVGGTPANRMIHRESNQLFIGPYVIDAKRNVRAILPKNMSGRLTGNARHLTDPADKIYFATMEEGFYEVDVNTLAVKELYKDANSLPDHSGPLLPGYHGKGLYSGQGRLIYANNGELSGAAQAHPEITSGVLAEWDGTNWQVVQRKQFTEITGPGGIYGNSNPESDPIWSVGWDHRSLILMLRQNGMWQQFRLPKSSHSYDGAHGWNTEWPRIRDIGEDTLLMTMHGAFWHFPRTFAIGKTGGIRPRSNYLKVIGDFTGWNGRLVFGCDDTAQADFLNKRKARGNLMGPGQSQSNLWFVEPTAIDRLGNVIGRGSLWENEDVKANQWSDPYLFAGYDYRTAFVSHTSTQAVTFDLEVDAKGNGQWEKLRSITVPAQETMWAEFSPQEVGEWVRVRPTSDCSGVTVFFHYSNTNSRPNVATPLFNGLATPASTSVAAGLIRARGEDKRTLHMAAYNFENNQKVEGNYYEIDADMNLRHVDDAAAYTYLQENVAIPQDVLSVDAASVLYVDETGRRWRLPKGDAAFDDILTRGENRVDREVVTERDIFNAHGTFYELPAENAGGFGKLRPVTTHNRRINDYCSWRGLMVMTGIDGGAGNPNIIRSDDGKAAVWVGAIDDLWQLGKTRGNGGPCLNTPLTAKVPSDPYLMTGYDQKSLALSHSNPIPVKLTIEVDVTGTGQWHPYKSFSVPVAQTTKHEFPTGFQAYWLRVVADQNCSATAQLKYS
ncbi:hypothetical protein IAD21_01358 [Abditibacteriota bacterium]|nr:hypothetical protein IAD21_01358 [Abditibacteriota bacterium]